MANIIAAIDFSDCSVNALEHAVSIASRGALDIHMIWVNNPSVTKTTIYSDSASELIDEIRKQFGKVQP
jgi:nucleotide-binding universal stress UspA family protein